MGRRGLLILPVLTLALVGSLGGPASADPVVTDTITVGTSPWGVAVSPDGARAYVTNAGSDTVSVIDTTTNTVTDTITVGNSPVGVAVPPDGARAYVTNAGNTTVSVIDTTTNTVTDTITVGNSPYGVAVPPDGARAYVTNAGNTTVSVIDTTTNTVTDTITVGNSPYGVAVSPDGTRAYVTNAGNTTVSVIDTTTNTVTDTIPVGNGPIGVAVSPDGTRAYVPNYGSDTVSVVALQPSAPTAVVATAGDGQVEVAWQPPTFTGGQPITGYTATAAPGGKTCTSNGPTKCTITGLTNDTAYTVTVTATNSIGTSAPSDPSAPVTPTRAVLAISPTTADFAEQTVCTTSPASTLTVSNTGQQPATLTAVSLTGTDTSDFTLTPGACAGATLTPGQSCQITAQFTPANTGARTATITITSNADPVTATLTGTGATTPTPPPTGKKKQTLSAKLPKRITRSGTTVITPRNARTNANQGVRTIVRGGPVKATAAGEVRYFKVIRGKEGKVSIRTYGYPNLKFKITQKAPATSDYKQFTRTATYRNGTKQ